LVSGSGDVSVVLVCELLQTSPQSGGLYDAGGDEIDANVVHAHLIRQTFTVGGQCVPSAALVRALSGFLLQQTLSLRLSHN
jgi:hypothetical protein